MFRISYACVTDSGRKHRWNDDRWFADLDSGLYLVTDGMAVSQPAQLVVDLLPKLLTAQIGPEVDLAAPQASEAVQAAIGDVSQQIHAAALAEPGAPWLGLGATIALGVVRSPHALLAHLGDSRIYLFRGGELTALTRDHSLTEELITLGKLRREQVDPRAFNGGPTRFAGMADEARADTRLVELQIGDRLLLCSDGLVCMLDDATIGRLLQRHADLHSAARGLVDAANEAGGNDNVTVLLLAAGS